MASSKGETIRPAEPAKADNGRQAHPEVKEPLLAVRGSEIIPSATRASTSGLPAFHLAPEGMGGVRLAVVWVT